MIHSYVILSCDESDTVIHGGTIFARRRRIRRSPEVVPRGGVHNMLVIYESPNVRRA